MVTGAIKLLGGEFVVKPDGIYTYAHYYEHPETGRRVIEIGMNHGGDKEYFERVTKILEGVDLVIYEVTRGQPRDPDTVRKAKEEAFVELHSNDPNIVFRAAMYLYFESAAECLQLVQEQDFLAAPPDWEPGDVGFFLQLTEEELDATYQRGLARLTLERKRAVIGYVKDVLERMEKKQFTRKDFGDGFVFFYSDPAIVNMLDEVLAKPRDEEVFECFDRLVAERDPQVVAIKFGAAHTAYQRELLERRGYVHARTVELCNLAF